MKGTKQRKSTGTFFWMHVTTQSAPLKATAVNPHAATALKAYSMGDENKTSTNLVESSLRRKDFDGFIES